MLVNKHYALDDYVPTDLVDIPWKYRFGQANDKISITKDAYDAFIDMWNAAQQEDIYLIVASGYRSKSEQEKEYKNYYNLKGEKYADTIAARPGYSEHQTGLAIDVYSKECYTSSTFHESKSYEWLINNSYKFGYILRYPKGKEKITGYNYESWHFRYLGVDLATKVHASGLTYDEYYVYYLE
jgi:D-alanyl-D-alanine carboxypeptidase